MFSHFGLRHIIPGGLGVTVFFFISGFLITRLLLAELNSTNTISLEGFYIRRAFRILPPLLFLILTCVIVAPFLHQEISWPQLSASLLFYKNYFELFTVHGPESTALPLNILWSLCIEEHFYIIYPFILYAYRKNTKSLLGLLTLLVVIVNIWRFVTLNYLDLGTNYNYYATDTRIDSILYGCILSLICQLELAPQLIKKISSNLLINTSLLLIGFTIVYRNDLFRDTLRYMFQGVALFPIFAFLIFSNRHTLVKIFLESPLVKWIGKLSYSLYLWHMFALKVVEFPAFSIAKPFVYPLAFVFSFILASISFYLVESSFIALGRKYSSKFAIKSNVQTLNMADRVQPIAAVEAQ